MALLGLNTSALGNPLFQIMMAPEIVPGAVPSYEICKLLMAYHPLGAKMTDKPVTLAQGKPRKIVVPKGPEEYCVEAFEAKWKELDATNHIFNLARQARGYGVTSMGILIDGEASTDPIKLGELYKKHVAINVWDPLNTAGSLVLNQDPNAMDFQKQREIAVAGRPYHRSRTITLMNENPLYIQYTTSAYGYVGRSVFQRALFPMKTFLQTMIADDLMAVKNGVMVAKTKQPGSTIDQVMQAVAGVKRNFLKEAATGNVLQIAIDETIETLNFQNAEGPLDLSRKHAIENIATAADMPALLINQEGFAEGFGEGEEDANAIIQYVDGIRTWLAKPYAFMDELVMHLAWNPEFYTGIQKAFPDAWGDVDYATAFYTWKNSFAGQWQPLREEPESERIKVDDAKFRAVIAAMLALLPILDAYNQAIVIGWMQDAFNERKSLFPSPLQLDLEAFEAHAEETISTARESALQEPKPDAPFSSRDSADQSTAMAALAQAVTALSEDTSRRLAGPRQLHAVG